MPGEVQEEGFKIGKTGAYVISIKVTHARVCPAAYSKPGLTSCRAGLLLRPPDLQAQPSSSPACIACMRDVPNQDPHPLIHS